MGLFDKVLGKDKGDGPITLDKNEAFAAVAVAAMASDGAISDEELQRAAMNLAAMSAFRDRGLRDMGATLNKVAGILKKRGAGTVMPAAKAALSKEQCEQAFFLAADLLLADGVVEKEERQFLEELRLALAVDEPMALKIVEVVVIKNRS
ncbi:MAG: Tellurite resistance protein TerB [Dehalococcoidia bacterium]|nr:Tellurite resistance protein TerB [Dehalococcoidia bacterium]